MTRTLKPVLTARDTDDRLSPQADIQLSDSDSTSVAKQRVRIDPNVTYQEIEGFGGAFTEAAATTLLKLSPENQDAILQAYFNADSGHGYNLCRTHINSCDFSLGNYAYTEVDGDTELEHFSIDRDRQALIPMIKRAMDIAGQPIKLFASPWSPPAWMKTTGMMNQGGKLKPEYRDAWARYYCRYIREYQAEGIDIWGLTVQNEPEAKQTWDSCIYSAEEEKNFVRDHLGPALHEAGLGDVKIIIWDHNRDQVLERSRVAYDDPEAAKYIWGTGFHWYVTETFENLRLVHECYPDKKLLFTEGCQEGGPHIGSWDTGERYGHNMLNDLNNWTVGWVDWNLILDETGGPNHVNNLCSAPIIADTQNDEVLYQSSYYYMGHFARYIQAGAKRILSASTHDILQTTAFRNPDGSLAVIVLNRSDKAMDFALALGDQHAPCTSPAHSIMTLVMENQAIGHRS